ncbi:ABC transporter permease [Pseudarthrobacter sp. SSS035]|uniref:ABC transporter permease n=1 Tax=Pseudarthrobacter sp. SSS035 TaxID=2931399 RepID=UPI00200C838D|nr:ABC transporter permease [Pseudarthrobacter sp. SSS035]
MAISVSADSGPPTARENNEDGEARPRRMARKHRGEKISLVLSLAVIIGFPLAGLLLPLPYSPITPDIKTIGLPPSWQHWFGTDGSGFDVFSRTVDAAGRDVPLAIGATVVALMIGVPLGLAATQGWRGEVIMRIVDAISALPIIVIAVVFVQILGGSAINIVVAIALVGIPRFIRVTRSSAITLRSARFVEAAVAIGCTPTRVAFNHVLRNSYGVVLAQATLTAANGISAIAALNFLGIGVRPPQPTWGSLIDAGSAMLIRGDWWAALFPTLAIVLFIGALNSNGNTIERHMESAGGVS